MKLSDELGISLPKNIKTEYNDLHHKTIFGTENKNKITNPIIEYILNDSDGTFVPLKWLVNVEHM